MRIIRGMKGMMGVIMRVLLGFIPMTRHTAVHVGFERKRQPAEATLEIVAVHSVPGQ